MKHNLTWDTRQISWFGDSMDSIIGWLEEERDQLRAMRDAGVRLDNEGFFSRHAVQLGTDDPRVAKRFRFDEDEAEVE